jgi:hypothetical protein
MLYHVALIRRDASEEHSAYIIRMKRIGELGTLAVTTRATWRNIPEDSILHSHHLENLKSYILLKISPWLWLPNSLLKMLKGSDDGV